MWRVHSRTDVASNVIQYRNTSSHYMYREYNTVDRMHIGYS